MPIMSGRMNEGRYTGTTMVRNTAEKVLKNHGLNNGTGKYDKFVNRMHSIYKETLLDQNKLEQVMEREFKKMYPHMNESVDTHIKPEDKVTLAQLKKSIYDYPVGTYLRYCTKGAINDISQYTFGLIKANMDHWYAYSSILGAAKDKEYTNDEVLKKIISSGAKNIAVKLGRR